MYILLFGVYFNSIQIYQQLSVITKTIIKVMLSSPSKTSKVRKCLMKGHGRSKIISLCLQKQCQDNRLVCAMCLNDNHMGHSTAPLDQAINKSKINNLRINCHQKDYQTKTVQQQIASKLEQLLNEVNLIFTRVQQFKKRVLDQNLLPMVRAIVKSFEMKAAQQAILKINQNASSQEINNIARDVIKLEQTHLTDIPSMRQAVQCMNFQLNKVFIQVQKQLDGIFQSIDQNIRNWSVYERTDWDQSAQQFRKFQEAKRQLISKQQQKTNEVMLPQREQKLYEYALKNNWHDLIRSVQSGMRIGEIQSLNIQNSSITKIRYFQPLVSMKELNLRLNKIARIQQLQLLKSLEVLNLSNNCITKIENLQSLTQLRVLDLNVNRISHIQNIDRLVELECLTLDFNQICKLQNLKKQYRLKILSIRNNQIVKLENIQSLKALEELSLKYNKIVKIEGLSDFQYLRRVQLNGNPIKKTQQDLNQISNLKKKQVTIVI